METNYNETTHNNHARFSTTKLESGRTNDEGWNLLDAGYHSLLLPAKKITDKGYKSHTQYEYK